MTHISDTCTKISLTPIFICENVFVVKQQANYTNLIWNRGNTPSLSSQKK